MSIEKFEEKVADLKRQKKGYLITDNTYYTQLAHAYHDYDQPMDDYRENIIRRSGGLIGSEDQMKYYRLADQLELFGSTTVPNAATSLDKIPQLLEYFKRDNARIKGHNGTMDHDEESRQLAIMRFAMMDSLGSIPGVDSAIAGNDIDKIFRIVSDNSVVHQEEEKPSFSGQSGRPDGREEDFKRMYNEYIGLSGQYHQAKSSFSGGLAQPDAFDRALSRIRGPLQEQFGYIPGVSDMLGANDIEGALARIELYIEREGQLPDSLTQQAGNKKTAGQQQDWDNLSRIQQEATNQYINFTSDILSDKITYTEGYPEISRQLDELEKHFGHIDVIAQEIQQSREAKLPDNIPEPYEAFYYSPTLKHLKNAIEWSGLYTATKGVLTDPVHELDLEQAKDAWHSKSWQALASNAPNRSASSSRVVNLDNYQARKLQDMLDMLLDRVDAVERREFRITENEQIEMNRINHVGVEQLGLDYSALQDLARQRRLTQYLPVDQIQDDLISRGAYNELITLQGRYANNVQQFHRGQTSEEDYRISINRMRHAVNSILESKGLDQAYEGVGIDLLREIHARRNAEKPVKQPEEIMQMKDFKLLAIRHRRLHHHKIEGEIDEKEFALGQRKIAEASLELLGVDYQQFESILREQRKNVDPLASSFNWETADKRDSTSVILLLSQFNGAMNNMQRGLATREDTEKTLDRVLWSALDLGADDIDLEASRAGLSRELYVKQNRLSEALVQDVEGIVDRLLENPSKEGFQELAQIDSKRARLLIERTIKKETQAQGNPGQAKLSATELGELKLLSETWKAADMMHETGYTGSVQGMGEQRNRWG